MQIIKFVIVTYIALLEFYAIRLFSQLFLSYTEKRLFCADSEDVNNLPTISEA